jgi:hypothetical protein
LAISLKIIAPALGVLLIIAAFDACAQWAPGKTVVYMGDLNLMRSSGTGVSQPRETNSSSQMNGPVGNSSAVNSSMINSTMNNSSMNIKTAMNSSSISTSSTNNPSVSKSPTVPMIDLSHYSKDRRDKNLTGYKNIMYPFAEAKGSTTSTAGGGGCGCG